MKIYKERITAFEEDLQVNRKKDQMYSVVRLIVILAVMFLVYLAISVETWGYVMAAGGLLLLFIILLFLHKKVRDRSRRLKAYIRVNRDELQFLDRDLSAFDDGKKFLDPEHFYSYDLDLFGPHSLFHHINRSATFKGEHLLAEALSAQDTETVEARQQSVRELSADIDFRQDFLVEASLLEEDEELQEKVKNWNEDESGSKGVFNKYLLYFLSVLAMAGMIYWFSFPSLQTFYIFAGLALLNLFVVGSQMKTITKKYANLDGISKSLLMYGRLLKQIEDRNHQSEYLKNLRAQLESSQGKASDALLKLSKILSGFDQLNNPMGALIMNALFLYHLHTLRSLWHWKTLYSGKIDGWIEVVGRFDELCSLANFGYNHSDFTFPKLSAEPVFEAEEIGHPLIGRGKRVNNSIGFKNYKYVVLTGSNMSGKSTFLKTLGVNLVLAKTGAPVCASKMCFFPFTVLTSMKMVDSIQKEESYFQAEIIRLKRLQNILKEGEPCFVLLDEILRGTNSEDKRNGTRLFMQGIGAFKAKGVIATHDIDIADLAQKQEEVFRAKYFESRFKDGELLFDYKLRSGICTTPNATELMRAQGII